MAENETRKSLDTGKPIVRIPDVPPLENRNDVYLIALYDKVAKECSNIVYMKTLDLVERFFVNSTKGMDPHELDVYLFGIYNVEHLQFKPLDVVLDTNALKLKIMKEDKNETS